MTISRPRRIFTRKRRYSWQVAAIVLLAVGEIGYITYTWGNISVPRCDEEAVQIQIVRLVQRATKDEYPNSVELVRFREVNKSVSGSTTVMRECAADVRTDEAKAHVIYEIRPDGTTNDYQVMLSSL